MPIRRPARWAPLAEPPIALCEVQAYVYAAYMARAWMAYDAGDTAVGDELTDRAAELKKRFYEQFWLPDCGYYAIALDKDRRPVDACASNMGHCLWFGLVDEDKAPLVAEKLMSPQMFSGCPSSSAASTGNGLASLCRTRRRVRRRPGPGRPPSCWRQA